MIYSSHLFCISYVYTNLYTPTYYNKELGLVRACKLGSGLSKIRVSIYLKYS